MPPKIQNLDKHHRAKRKAIIETSLADVVAAAIAEAKVVSDAAYAALQEELKECQKNLLKYLVSHIYIFAYSN